MPVAINSPARNLFLLASSGENIVTNFFKRINRPTTQYQVYDPSEIRYSESDQKFIMSGSHQDSNTFASRGWLEKRSDTGVAEWDVLIQSTIGNSTTLNAFELNGSYLVACGKANNIPWVAKYSTDGLFEWSSTSNTGDLEYADVAIDSDGNVYACGSGNGDAFVEKLDENGNYYWGKSSSIDVGNVSLVKCAVNSKGHVVSVGKLEDTFKDKGYIVKVDVQTGEVLWDKTIEDPREATSGSYWQTECTGIFIDELDQIYVVGNILDTISGDSRGYLIKYTSEGNLIWQTETEENNHLEFYDVKSDTSVQQTVVFGRYFDGSAYYGVLSKYAKDGRLIWRRRLYNSSTSELTRVNIDVDPSFYYLLFIDELDEASGIPTSYVYGKVSSSGNGLGDFDYPDGDGYTFFYEILNVQDKIGRLSDGSVRQDTSDLITYPFSANKLLFDDLATQVSNKKRQMDTADSFEYSGSPAIRPADFQELNLLGDVYSGSGDWLDQSGKGNDGVVNGATHNAAGYWEFDGVDDRILIDDDGRFHFAENGSDFGIEAWVRRTGNNNAYTTIAASWGQSTPIDNWILSHNLGILGFVWAPYSTGNYFLTGGSLTLNNWHHVIATRSGSNFKLYVDGIETASGTSSGSASSTLSYVEIGHYGSTSSGGGADSWFDGDIGEARIYPRALTAAQVFQNYNATKSKYINEAPDTAPKIGPGIVYDSNLLLNYDFGNKATYNRAHNLYDNSTNYGSSNWNLQGPNGVTTNTTEVLSPVGDYTATKWQPTTTTSQYIYDGIGAMGTETHTMSVWVRAADGETTTFSMNLFSPTQQPSDFTATDKWQRFTWTFTPQNQSTAYPVIVRELDKALYIWGPQIEKASTAGNYVPTYATSVGAPTTVKNLSSSSIDGTINGATFNSAGYFSFDGVSDTITFPTGVSVNTIAGISVEVWVRADDATKYMDIFDMNDTYGIWMVFQSGLIKGSFSVTANQMTAPYSINTWYHFVIAGSGNSNVMYLNGVQVDTASASVYSGIVDFNTARIGNVDGNRASEYLDGDVAEFRFYNRALTATEVSQNFNATRSKYGV